MDFMSKTGQVNSVADFVLNTGDSALKTGEDHSIADFAFKTGQCNFFADFALRQLCC